MPVTLELIEKPSAQDAIDLEKIYKDYPLKLRWPDLQKLLAEQPNRRVYAGLFNDRLLGAASVYLQDNTLIIEHLCMRSITRKRNVARDLLRLILEAESHPRYQFSLCQESPGMHKLLTNAGFNQQGNDFILVKN